MVEIAVMQRLSVLVVTLTAISCGKSSPSTGNPPPDPGKAPLECLRKATDDPRIDLKDELKMALCSGATDPEDPIECFVEAIGDSSLELNAFGALLVCSPFNLDAFNASVKACPGVSTGIIELRLSTIEQKLEELARRR